MRYAIIGSDNIGSDNIGSDNIGSDNIGSDNIGVALAYTFARKNIEVALANSRGAETLAALAKDIGSSVSAQSVQDATGAEMIFLAVPYSAHKDVATLLPDWSDKIVVDLTNAFGIASGEPGGRVSSKWWPGIMVYAR